VWFGRDGDERFRKFYGDIYDGSALLPKYAEIRANLVMNHVTQNVNYPFEAHQKGIKIPQRKYGIRLAREINNEKGKLNGLEIVVFDKGPGIRSVTDECGVLDVLQRREIKKNPCHEGYLLCGDGVGMREAIRNSDVYEIETMGEKWEKKAPDALTHVPFVAGTKVRAEVIEYSEAKLWEITEKLRQVQKTDDLFEGVLNEVDALVLYWIEKDMKDK